MPRIKLKARENYSFQTRISVRTTDLNYGGHLGNDRLLALIHEARLSFLADHGFSERDCGGVSLILSDAVLVFQREAFAGDVLQFEVSAGEPTRNGFRVFYKVTRIADQNPIALAETGMVCFDYEAKKQQRLPSSVRLICEE